MQRAGVDVDSLLISQPDSGESALEILDQVVRSSGCDIIVVDSVAALTPRAELDGEIGDRSSESSVPPTRSRCPSCCACLRDGALMQLEWTAHVLPSSLGRCCFIAALRGITVLCSGRSCTNDEPSHEEDWRECLKVQHHHHFHQSTPHEGDFVALSTVKAPLGHDQLRFMSLFSNISVLLFEACLVPFPDLQGSNVYLVWQSRLQRSSITLSSM